MPQIISKFVGFDKFQNNDGTTHYFNKTGKMLTYEEVVNITKYHPHKMCSDCRDSEREENLDDEIMLVVVTEEGRKGIFKKSYMCQNHRYMYCSDGYKVKSVETGEIF